MEQRLRESGTRMVFNSLTSEDGPSALTSETPGGMRCDSELAEGLEEADLWRNLTKRRHHSSNFELLHVTRVTGISDLAPGKQASLEDGGMLEN